MIDLQKFCGHRWDLQIDKPFTHGDWTYATNCYCVVRVPVSQAQGASVTKPSANVMEEMFAKPNGLSYRTLPALPPEEPETCFGCLGIGKICKCSDCNGKGIVYWESPSGKEYSADCDMCDSECWIPFVEGAKNPVECEYCEGTGKTVKQDKVTIDGVFFDAEQLRKVATLPNVEAAVHNRCLWFRFDGGEGKLSSHGDYKFHLTLAR